jgi:hypothetical protein
VEREVLDPHEDAEPEGPDGDPIRAHDPRMADPQSHEHRLVQRTRQWSCSRSLLILQLATSDARSPHDKLRAGAVSHVPNSAPLRGGLSPRAAGIIKEPKGDAADLALREARPPRAAGPWAAHRPPSGAAPGMVTAAAGRLAHSGAALTSSPA